jgi:hypothetical protein
MVGDVALKWLFRVLVLLAVAVGVGSYFAASWIETEWQLLNGREAFLRNDFQVAVEKLPPAVEALEERGFTERSAYWRRALAQSHLAVRQDERALDHYRRLTDSKAYFALGLRAAELRDWAASIQLLTRAVQAEPGCGVCKDALANAIAAEAAYHTSLVAGEAQTKSLEEMRAPAMCLGYLAVVTNGSELTAGLLQPRLLALVQKAGATGPAAENGVRTLLRLLSREWDDVLRRASNDLCPPVSDNALFGATLAWVELVPFASDAHSAVVAADQSTQLARSLAAYGQAVVSERDSRAKLTSADALRTAHWDMLVIASKNPKFIEGSLASLALPSPAPAPGWLQKTWDTINPSK